MFSGKNNKSSDKPVLVELKIYTDYTFEQLLAECHSKAEVTADDTEWLDNNPINRGLI